MSCLSFNIAVAGKGGSVKTSLASLVIRYLKNSDTGPILAVDADANANLWESLGLTVRQTVGQMLDEFQGDKINIPAGMTKELYLDFKLNEILVESPRIDLLTMGRGEGPECYCYPNVILKKFADTLADNYAYMVMDNESGMEHLSRRTTQDVDALLLVSNHSVNCPDNRAGIQTQADSKETAARNQHRSRRARPAGEGRTGAPGNRARCGNPGRRRGLPIRPGTQTTARTAGYFTGGAGGQRTHGTGP